MFENLSPAAHFMLLYVKYEYPTKQKNNEIIFLWLHIYRVNSIYPIRYIAFDGLKNPFS